MIHISFGSESGDRESFLFAGKTLSSESKEFKKLLKSQLNEGISLAKAKFLTVKELGGDVDESLISSPNNILGVEYVKEILSVKSKLEICPMIRTGDHNDKRLKKGITGHR